MVQCSGGAAKSGGPEAGEAPIFAVETTKMNCLRCKKGGSNHGLSLTPIPASAPVMSAALPAFLRGIVMWQKYLKHHQNHVQCMLKLCPDNRIAICILGALVDVQGRSQRGQWGGGQLPTFGHPCPPALPPPSGGWAFCMFYGLAGNSIALLPLFKTSLPQTAPPLVKPWLRHWI